MMTKMETKTETQLGSLASQINVNQNKWDDGQEEMKAHIGSLSPRMDGHHDEMMAIMKACIGATEACLEKREPTPEEIEVVAEHQEIPNEQHAVETIGALADRSGDRQPAVG
jgi:hypothetical protein